MMFVPVITACLLGIKCFIGVPPLPSETVAKCNTIMQQVESGMMSVEKSRPGSKPIVVNAKCMNVDELKTLLLSNKDKLGPDGIGGFVITLDKNLLESEASVPKDLSPTVPSPNNPSENEDNNHLKPLTPEQKARGDVQI